MGVQLPLKSCHVANAAGENPWPARAAARSRNRSRLKAS